MTMVFSPKPQPLNPSTHQPHHTSKDHTICRNRRWLRFSGGSDILMFSAFVVKEVKALLVYLTLCLFISGFHLDDTSSKHVLHLVHCILSYIWPGAMLLFIYCPSCVKNTPFKPAGTWYFFALLSSLPFAM